jgi:hypothetical protein
MLCILFRYMIVPIGLISVDLLTSGFFHWTSWISKSFKLPTFLNSQSRDRVTRVVETERHLFPKKQIVTLSPNAHIRLDAALHTKSHCFSLLPSNFLLFVYYLLHRAISHSIMTGRTDEISPITGDVAASSSKAMPSMESSTTSASSSCNAATQMTAKKKLPMSFEYWKMPTVIEANLAAYHATDWLPSGVLSSTIDLEFPTIDKTIVVCFESHLMAGLDLPKSKFIISILNFLMCELVHLNLNITAVLSCVSMMCECWLSILSDTSLF